MSKKSGLHRHYDKLEPEERFRLDVLAMARGAEVESERLTRSCPMRRYSMTDLAFSDRWRAALEISTITFMEIEKHLAKIQMVRAFREMGPYLRTLMSCNGEDAYFGGHRAGSAHAWAKAGMEGEPPGWESDDEEAEKNADPQTDEGLKEVSATVLHVEETVRGLMDGIERELTQDAYTVWSAYLAFCEGAMSLDGRKLLGAIAPEIRAKAETIDAMAERFGLEADGDQAAELEGSMRGLWKRYMDRAA